MGHLEDPTIRRRTVDRHAIARIAAVCVIAVPLADCASQVAGRHPSERKYGVASSPRVIPEGQPIPKGGGRDMVGKPYVVAGRTYIPHPGKGYDREGWASWYGTAFHGRLTANGEIFDRASIAAAHPTLPLPSYVRVTNLANNRSMVVRVNDRGPYERDRVIDLSERAADALGFHRKGTSRVRVQYVGRASLAGSDDEKLLATLRTDGSPATLDGPRTMLAGGDGGLSRPPEPTDRTLPQLQGPDDGESPAMRRPALRTAAADGAGRRDAHPDDEDPVDVLPPRRPSFARAD